MFMAIKRKKKIEKPVPDEQDLSEVYYELQTRRDEIKHLSDGELFDNLMVEIQLHDRNDLDQFYDKLAQGEKLTKEERKQLEGFYLIVNMELGALE
jgi:uncharacterized coiled-coil DUF342 family protein